MTLNKNLTKGVNNMKDLPIGSGVQIYIKIDSDNCPIMARLKAIEPRLKQDLRRYKYKKASNLQFLELPTEVRSIANMLDVGQSFKSKYISTLKRVK